MQKILRRIGMVCLIILAALLLLVLLVWGGLNIAKFVLYSDYYSIESDVCKNPGLSDGFVCQGICISEENERILVSGYMADHTASRIYITDLDSKSYYVSIESEGKAFTGHAGGIATVGDKVYVASEEKVYTMSLSEILAAGNGDVVDMGEGISVNNAASFIYADENYVYVGEFHDGGAYVTDHPYETPDGKYYAIVTRYTHDDLTSPDKIYSIRNKVQGICFTPDGKVVLSTSYGLSDSVYYVYDESEAIDSGLTFDGAPVFYLNGCKREVKGPAMAEGLDYYNGEVITLTECASDKYVFGKFFFADKIVSLDFK